MSYEMKLTSGNEADRNQSAMTAIKRDKTQSPCRRKRTLVSLSIGISQRQDCSNRR